MIDRDTERREMLRFMEEIATVPDLARERTNHAQD
jgi:hypothetical protein